MSGCAMRSTTSYAELECPKCKGRVKLGAAFKLGGMRADCGTCRVQMVVREWEEGGVHVIRDPKDRDVDAARYLEEAAKR